MRRPAAPYPAERTALGSGAASTRGTSRETALRLVALHPLLDQSDSVILRAALTSEFVGLIGAEEVARMKAAASLVNAGRGRLPNTAALRGGRTAGSGLDVFDSEPLSAEDELLSVEQVVLRPQSLRRTECFSRNASASAVHSPLEVAVGHGPRRHHQCVSALLPAVVCRISDPTRAGIS